MKSGVREVLGSIPAFMAEWTKGLGLVVHNEVWCAGGCGFDPCLLGQFGGGKGLDRNLKVAGSSLSSGTLNISVLVRP